MHRLSNIDTSTMTAICAVCGPVEIKNGDRLRCANKVRSKRLKARYGIDAEANYSGESCAICGGRTRIAYDHNHQTGSFRGWLCMKCNTALGLVNDNPEILEKMITYLKGSETLASVPEP